MGSENGGTLFYVAAGTCDFSGSPVDLGGLIINWIFLAVFIFIAIFWLHRVKKYLAREASPSFPVFGFTLALVAAFLYDSYLFSSSVDSCADDRV